MKFSIVTISFNQAEFLEKTMRSVLSQEGVELEYIVVDPGSTDGSRALIERHRDELAAAIFEKDQGPSDGLNRGFAQATGDIFGYLNSDDTFEPGALARVAAFFEANPDVDVVTGHAWLTDPRDVKLRRLWSERFRPTMIAYGAAIQIQPSTFFRRSAFERTNGFNVENRSNWDGELLVDLHLAGARFAIVNAFLSCYRLHDTSITNAGGSIERMAAWGVRRFEKIKGRSPTPADMKKVQLYRGIKHLLHPRATLERILRGPVYRRGV